MSLLLDRTRAEPAFDKSGEGVELEGIVSSLTDLVRPLRQVLGDLLIMYYANEYTSIV